MSPEYSSVIRTDRCTPLLERVVAVMRGQSAPPREIVFVDSSNDPVVHAALAALGDRVVDYPREPFNFSKALNIGAAAATGEYLHFISSHIVLDGVDVMRDAIERATREDCQAWYLWPHEALKVGVVTWADFNGGNGISNSCSFVPRAAVLERGFREEVFSAEDQEWSVWALRDKRFRILSIGSPRLLNLNPNINILKTINEEIAIAYYSYRRGLWPDRVLGRLMRSAIAWMRRRPDRARMHFAIAKGLVAACFREPRRQSKYY